MSLSLSSVICHEIIFLVSYEGTSTHTFHQYKNYHVLVPSYVQVTMYIFYKIINYKKKFEFNFFVFLQITDRLHTIKLKMMITHYTMIERFGKLGEST